MRSLSPVTEQYAQASYSLGPRMALCHDDRYRLELVSTDGFGFGCRVLLML